MKKILLILFTLLTSISFLLFHEKGNEFLKPYISTYLESQLKEGMSIEVKHLKVDLNYLECTAILNDFAQIEVNGKVSLLTQGVNLKYKLKSNGFKNEKLTFDNQVDITGTAIGTFDEIKIQGEGETLKSHINYALNIKNNVIENIIVSIKKADITSLLQLASQPNFATGKIDVDINIPNLEDINTQGTAKIILHKTTLNDQVFKKELEIELPPRTVVTADIDSIIDTETFQLEGIIKSNLATLKLSKTTYNINSEKLILGYLLTVPRLSKLIFLTKQKLEGALYLTGNLQLNDKALHLTGSSNSLDGKIDFNYNGKELNSYFHEVSIPKLLYMLDEKIYATGKLTANIKLSNLDSLRGTFELKTQNAKTINHTVQKELDINFGKEIPFTLNSKGNIILNIVKIQSTLDSEIFNYRSNDMQYNLNNNKLNSTYLFTIPKLSKLNAITDKSLKGKLLIKGRMNYYTDLLITGTSNSLGGNIDFKLKDKTLNSTIYNVPVEKLMYLLSYPQVFKANLMGQLHYDLVTSKGKFTSTLNQAQLLTSNLTELIKQIRGVDLTKERYNKTYLNAILKKNLIVIDFKAKSKKVLLSIPSGRINKLTNTINASYNINIDNKDLAGKIKGKISNPHISLDSSKFIHDEIKNVMQGDMVDDKLKYLGIGTKETEVIKGFLDDFFK